MLTYLKCMREIFDKVIDVNLYIKINTQLITVLINFVLMYVRIVTAFTVSNKSHIHTADVSNIEKILLNKFFL